MLEHDYSNDNLSNIHKHKHSLHAYIHSKEWIQVASHVLSDSSIVWIVTLKWDFFPSCGMCASTLTCYQYITWLEFPNWSVFSRSSTTTGGSIFSGCFSVGSCMNSLIPTLRSTFQLNAYNFSIQSKFQQGYTISKLLSENSLFSSQLRSNSNF